MDLVLNLLLFIIAIILLINVTINFIINIQIFKRNKEQKKFINELFDKKE